jgi:hypothetical protein
MTTVVEKTLHESEIKQDLEEETQYIISTDLLSICNSASHIRLTC